MRLFSIMAIVVAAMAFSNVSFAAECPCDIYKTGTAPCVAAYSTVRLMSSTYTGPLYQVRRTSDKQTKDIYPIASVGIANAAAQDSFLGAGAGTISKIYDQSGKGNHLVKALKGCYQCPNGTGCKDDNESDAKGRSLMINGRKAYALKMKVMDGYRNDTTTDMPEGLVGQGIYMVADGKNFGDACCWDFGNASKDNCYGPTGIMVALYFGTGFWGKGAGNGPWFQADLEGGVWSGGSAGSGVRNMQLPSSNMDYAFGILKVSSTPTESQYAIRVADGKSGNLTTAYDGKAPKLLRMQGGIILGIGGDNSNSSWGTFFEGVITKGRPTNLADTLVLKNVQAAGYGNTIVSTMFDPPGTPTGKSMFNVQYIPGTPKAVIGFTLQNTSRVHMNIFDQQGRLISNLTSNVFGAGNHNIIWDASKVSAGVYVARVEINDKDEWSGKIIIGK